MSRKIVIQWLRKHTADPRKAFSFFTQGGFIFSGGVMGFILASQFIEPSLKQEIVGFICLIVAVTGVALALWGYLCLSVFKIITYIFDRENTDDNSN